MTRLGRQLMFPVEQIRQVRLYRKDLGDIGALKQSLKERGMVCPLVIAPDGLLISGARRLAAVKELGWVTAPVYVASDVSDDLRARLAITNGLLHTKSLTMVEMADLYQELRELLIEERKLVRQGLKTQTGKALGKDEAGVSPGSFGQLRTMAARAITESDSSQRLDRVCHVKQVAEDEAADPHLRQVALDALAEIERDDKVNGPWLRVRRAETVGQIRDLTANPNAPPAIKERAARFATALATEEDPSQLAKLITTASAICQSANASQAGNANQAAEAELRRVRFVISATMRGALHLSVEGLSHLLTQEDHADAQQAATLMQSLADAIGKELEPDQPAG